MNETNTSNSDPKSTRVVDLLLQIERLNIMIAEHSGTSADETLIAQQYEVLRSDFLSELGALLSDYGIEAELRVAE